MVLTGVAAKLGTLLPTDPCLQAKAEMWCSCAGFVKVAAEHGAALVPIAALGEVTGLRNAIDIPWMQAWSYKRLGFPVPYLVVGR